MIEDGSDRDVGAKEGHREWQTEPRVGEPDPQEGRVQNEVREELGRAELCPFV